jgi:hypothetical protein
MLNTVCIAQRHDCAPEITGTEPAAIDSLYDRHLANHRSGILAFFAACDASAAERDAHLHRWQAGSPQAKAPAARKYRIAKNRERKLRGADTLGKALRCHAEGMEFALLQFKALIDGWGTTVRLPTEGFSRATDCMSDMISLCQQEVMTAVRLERSFNGLCWLRDTRRQVDAWDGALHALGASAPTEIERDAVAGEAGRCEAGEALPIAAARLLRLECQSARAEALIDKWTPRKHDPEITPRLRNAIELAIAMLKDREQCSIHVAGLSRGLAPRPSDARH